MKRDRSFSSVVISFVLHLVLGSALLWVASLPRPLRQWLTLHRETAITVERIGYFRLPGQNRDVKARAGGNGRAVRGVPRAPAEFVAPTEIPSGVPLTKPGAAAVPEAGTGPVISAGGAGPGIMPQFHDARIWLPPGAVIIVPKSANVRIDSALHEALNIFRDSMAKKNVATALGTTFTAGGKKYGVDQNNIYIADFKIPAALLALLPIRPTGYMTVDQQNIARQSMEINYNAGRALDAEDFHTAVKRIRERKEREKRAREAAAGKGPIAAAPTADPPPPHREPRADPVALQTP